jgi:hypothetical protein
MSEIERDKLSLQELKGFARDHLQSKDSMKNILQPGNELVNGLVFLYQDNACVKMVEYIFPG